MGDDPLRRILQEKARSAMRYVDYQALMARNVAEGSTTGAEQREDLIAYTALNKVRMDRLDRTVRIPAGLSSLLHRIQKQTWLVLTETWCGDSAQNLPAIAAMAAATDRVDLLLLLRDEHPDLMERFLTKGARAIPKLIAIGPEGEVNFTWGPRPATAQAMVMEQLALPPVERLPSAARNTRLHAWYARDRNAELLNEFGTLLAPFAEPVV